MKLFVLEILFNFLYPEATITYGLLIIILLAITFQTQLSSLPILLEYVVTGTDLNNCSNKDSVLVLVNDLPIIVTSNDASICYGDSIVISASGGTTYQWLNQDSISNINSFKSRNLAVFKLYLSSDCYWD